MPGSKVFISDIHLSSQKAYDGPCARYLPDQHETRLCRFLEKQVIGRRGEVEHCVLLGDIFDNWLVPFWEVPPSYEEVFADNPRVMDLLRGIASEPSMSLVYAHGNHDFDLGEDELKTAIPGIQVCDRFKDGPLYAEHGHAYTLFNSLDFDADPAGRPIGYSITRLSDHLGGRLLFGYANNSWEIFRYLDDLWECGLTSRTLFGAFLEGLMERAKAWLDPADADKAGWIVMGPDEREPWSQVKFRYDQSSKIRDPKIAKQLHFNEKDLSSAAETLAEREGHPLVVFGHTHAAEVERDWFLQPDRLYANAGCWCKEQAHSVEVIQKAGRLEVLLNLVDAEGNTIDRATTHRPARRRGAAISG